MRPYYIINKGRLIALGTIYDKEQAKIKVHWKIFSWSDRGMNMKTLAKQAAKFGFLISRLNGISAMTKKFLGRAAIAEFYL